MTGRSFWSLVASISLGVGLIAWLCVRTDIDLAAIANLLLTLRPEAFTVLVLLVGLNTFVAGEKWRLVSNRIRQAGEGVMPRPFHFALSAIGLAIGQVLPIVVSTALSRSLGARLIYDQAILRNAAATVFEQSFDLVVALFLAAASTTVIVFGGHAADWTCLAIATSVLALLLAAPAVGLLTRHLHWFASRPAIARRYRVARWLSRAARSKMLAADLTRQLFALSVLRFCLLALMAGATTEAVRLDVPLWQLAAALPLVVLATAVPVTPAGLGVNEWTFASALVAFGTPFDVAAQWAVLNRILVTIAALLIGVVGALVGFGVRSSLKSPSVP